ncbi:phage recombination protein Bet [Acinetobacter calcoaceticus]|uniref:phage recombination protein Bet n=1 Tax=Acinetobacter calcoaceticus TaxID=471 RepID=UPI003AF4FF49
MNAPINGTLITTQIANVAETLGLVNVNPQELKETLIQTAFRTETPATDAQMASLLIVAGQYKLNPWTKEIYAFPDKNKGIIPVVGVDGWSRIINGNSNFNGMEFKFSENMVQMEGAKVAAPEWVECIIYRKDRDHPTVVREYLAECYRAPFKSKTGYVVEGPWQSHPSRFLRHKATIQCARLAFGFVGIHDQDEAERIAESGQPIKDVTPDAADNRPTLTEEQIEKAIQKIRNGKGDIEALKHHYNLSEEQLNYIQAKTEVLEHDPV